MNTRFIDLFAGIGGIRLPFDELKYECVFSSEWDKAACETYKANFGECPQGDITQISEKDIPAHELLLAGFPCQAFSIMGKMKGFSDTRGTMFFEIVGFRNELDYFKFNFDFQQKKYDLNQILESDDSIDPSLFASERIIQKRQERIKGKNVFYPSIWHENKSGNISILDHACALRTGASYNYLLVNGNRRPSSRELLRLQGFPDTYKIVVSHQEIRRQTGNSVAVPMIREIAKKIDNIIKDNYGITDVHTDIQKTGRAVLNMRTFWMLGNLMRVGLRF